MRKLMICLFYATIVLFVQPAWAQRGTGDQVGLARQGVKPQVLKLEGEVLELVKGPCERTTGCAETGFHLRVKTAETSSLNLHLGPMEDVEKLVTGLTVGKTIHFEGFRTNKLGPDEMIAKSLAFDGKEIGLRDETLRPVWAGKSKRQKQHGARGLGKGREKSGKS